MTVLRWGSSTDVGMVRETNQDSFLVAEPLFAVADGMGGHQGGEVASATAVEVLQSSFTEPTKESLLEAVRRANAKVWDKGQLDETLHGMGTTLTAVAKLCDEERGTEVLAVINVGDSRGYLLRDGELTQLTTDHNLVEELIASGEITPEEAETHPRRNIITRALGVEPTVEADLEQLIPQAGDRVLLCSDGLIREVTDDQIAAVLRRLKNPDEAAKELVARAKANGGNDNITVVIVDVEEDPSDSVSVPTAKHKKPRKAPKAKAHRKPRARFTLRTFIFIVAILALLGVAGGSVVWYARASFYVGLEGQNVAIYRGRPDPVLWFKPTIAERTNVQLNEIPANEQPRLAAGATQVSLSAAHRYIENLVEEQAQAQAVANPTASTTTTTIIYEDATEPPVAGPSQGPGATANPVATTSAP